MNQHLFHVRKMKKRVCLEPKDLSSQYLDIIINEIKKNYEETCEKNIGYISQIVKIENIIHEEIMSMIPNVYFLVECSLLSYLPEIGQVLDMHVSFIFNHGIFGSFEKIKILIPIQSCHHFSIKQDFSGIQMIHNTKSDFVIKKDSIIKVEIKNVRFEKENYSCIATLYHDDVASE